MLLNTDDRRTLEAFVPREGALKRLVPIIFAGDLVAAVVIYFVLEPPANILAAGALVLMGVVASLVLMKAAERGSGSATRVLAGREPGRQEMAVVVDDSGDEPNPWSLQLDNEISGSRYVHLGVKDTEWKPAPGQRVRLTGFGDERRPFHGVVLVTADGTPARHWLYSVNLSRSPRYVHNPS